MVFHDSRADGCVVDGTDARERKWRSAHCWVSEGFEMTDFVERIVQKMSEAALIESAVSHIVAGVLENTATKLSRGEPAQVEDDHSDEEEVA
jgi:hypothetical protein